MNDKWGDQCWETSSNKIHPSIGSHKAYCHAPYSDLIPSGLLSVQKVLYRIGSCLPACREVFGAQAGPGNSTTQTELQALFDIIGTPHWADVEALQSPAWRKYLQRLPGKAPTLYRCPHAFCCMDCYSVHACMHACLSTSQSCLSI